MVLSVAVDTVVWMASAAADDVDGFFSSIARQRRLKATRKYIMMAHIYNIIGCGAGVGEVSSAS